MTLSIEWQCEQLACAKAFPARTFGSALHTVAERKTFIVITTDDAILTFIWGVLIAINCSESARETNVLGSTSKHPIRSVTLQTQRCLERMGRPKESASACWLAIASTWRLPPISRHRRHAANNPAQLWLGGIAWIRNPTRSTPLGQSVATDRMRVLGVNVFGRIGDEGGFARVHPTVKARGKGRLQHDTP